MVTLANLKVLHPKIIENVYLKELQGNMIATQFLPERSIPFPEFVYQRYGELGGVTPKSAEGAGTPISSTEYSQERASTVEYREGELISEQSIKFMGSVRNFQLDAAEHLAERMALRQELNTVDALSNNAAHVIDLEGSSGGAWNEENADIMDDLQEAIRLVKKEGHTRPDVALLNSDVESDILQNSAFKNWNVSGNLIQSPLLTGSVEGFSPRGLQLFVSDAFYLAEERTAKANEVKNFVVDNKVLIFKRGGDLGNTYVAEPYQSRMYPLEDNRAFKMQVWKNMAAVIKRPQFIVRVDNVRSEV
jgi:hypothetical protein